ncbi:MAG: glycosyltransferase [Candidatus Aminicenantes bacterium]|nr:glycosyltransferase [Candidatus Aminicenantes bacterium]
MWDETYQNVELKARSETTFITSDVLKEKIDPILIFLIVVFSSIMIVAAFKLKIFSLWAEFLQSSLFLKISTYPLFLSALFIIGGLLFRTFLWLRYKPLSVKEGEKVLWPVISVIMPAFNEEELVEKSIDSIFASDYPADKLEVISINDGSKDDTFSGMLRAKEKYGSKLKVINFEKNLGKRKALYAGLKKSRGEVIVTVDTDSKIEKSALKNLVIPLVKDQKTGAVAGRVEVLNEKQNLLTRMLAIRYSLSFNFGRAYQSVYGAVFCCPGALTAYRRNVLMTFIHDWVNQTFLKTSCTYGEDRALTTCILKAGYMTRFQSNAMVFTEVPKTFNRMNKMYLRWTRSYIRESVLFARFMFSDYRGKNKWLPIFDFFFLNILHPFHLFSLVLIIYSFAVNPIFILRHIAFLVIAAFFLSLYYLRAEKSLNFLYGIPYALITAFCLWWIVPYAALTMRNRSWMTR